MIGLDFETTTGRITTIKARNNMNEKLEKKVNLYLNVIKWIAILAVIAVVAGYFQNKADSWKKFGNQIQQINADYDQSRKESKLKYGY